VYGVQLLPIALHVLANADLVGTQAFVARGEDKG
jgi:hypothetical protein